jgi:hypothetical protein
MQGNPTVMLAGSTVRDNPPTVDPDATRHWRKQILIAVGAKSPFKLDRDRDQVFHGNLPCQLDVAIC